MTSKMSRVREYVESRHDGVKARQIAEALGMDRNNVTSMLSQLKNRLYRELDYTSEPPSYIWFPKEVAGSRCSPVPPTVDSPLVPAPARKTYSGLMDVAVEAAIGVLVSEFAEKLEQRLPLALEDKMREVVNRQSPKVQVAQPKKKSVCVVGLLPVQAGMISTEFGDVFDFRFIEASERNGHMKSSVASSDTTIVMAGFVSHATCELIKTQCDKPEYVHGGMTKLRDVLTGMYVAD